VSDPNIGLGGAPTRATTLPEGAAERKQFPVASGVLDYFPDALVAVAQVSYLGNEQHNPGQPLHWARGKSMDQDDTIIRHFLQRGLKDTDGQRHSAKLAWRALAMLQLEIEAEQTGAAWDAACAAAEAQKDAPITASEIMKNLTRYAPPADRRQDKVPF